MSDEPDSPRLESPGSAGTPLVAPGTVDAAAAGNRRSADAITSALRSSAPGPGRDDLLDDVARAAASGNQVALELLLGAIDDLHLAGPSIRRLVLDPAMADDVAQDVLITVAERVGSFRGDSRFRTWLFQVARFKAIDHLRRQRDSVPLGDDDVTPSDAERMSSLIATRTAIREAIEELPEYYRDAVVLRDVDRLSYQEIATRSDIPLNTAKTRVARGRALLAGKLAATMR